MPNQYVNKVVKSDGTTLIDLTSDTVTSSDHIMSGYVGHLANGSQVTGTGQGGPSATAHTIYFEFSDGTDITLTGYWDSSFISDAIRATTPSTYGQKTVDSASLDGVEWYVRPTETWETVYDSNVALYEDGGFVYFWITDLANVTIPDDSVWRVTLDGTVYNLTAHKFNINYGGLEGLINVLGNTGHSGGDDDGSGVPFCFYNYNGIALCGDTSLSSGTYALKIERQVTA